MLATTMKPPLMMVIQQQQQQFEAHANVALETDDR